MIEYPYVWRVKTVHPERFGQRCRVLKRGSLNSRLVEFDDGFRMITNGNYYCKPVSKGDEKLEEKS